MTVNEAYEACQSLVRESGSSFYYGMRLLPPPKRAAIYTLYAFSRVADDAVDAWDNKEPKAAGLIEAGRLLDDALSAAYAESTHPIVVALGDAIRRFNLSERCFRELLAGMAMDLEQTSYATFEDLLLYCRRAAGTVGELCVEIFGYHDEAVPALAVDLGVAMQLTNILRDLNEDLERGRVYLPTADLNQAEYSLQALSRREQTKAFYVLMKIEADRAHAYYRRAKRLIQLVDADAQSSIAMLYQLYYQLLKKIEAREYDVFGPKISLSTREKLLYVTPLLWRRRAR